MEFWPPSNTQCREFSLIHTFPESHGFRHHWMTESSPHRLESLQSTARHVVEMCHLRKPLPFTDSCNTPIRSFASPPPSHHSVRPQNQSLA
ncbi:hypothetical protein PAMP_017023 [Pampus punctatissimus]